MSWLDEMEAADSAYPSDVSYPAARTRAGRGLHQLHAALGDGHLNAARDLIAGDERAVPAAVQAGSPNSGRRRPVTPQPATEPLTSPFAPSGLLGLCPPRRVYHMTA